MPFEHLAQGEFLQWCMDDDILLPDKITRMVDAFQSEPTATLVTSVRGVIDEGGNFLGQWKDAPSIHGTYGCFGGAAVGHAMLMDHSSFLGEPSAVLFRRRDLVHHYWRAESRGYKVLSDCAMWLELLEKGGAVVFAQPLSLFRTHSGQEQRQPESLVRAAVEWRRLIEEYWHKRIFLTKEEDYRAALTALRESCKSVVDPLLPQVSPALRREYGSGKPAIHILLMNRITECATVRVDAPLTPQMKGDIAATFHLRGITWEDRQKARAEILTARQEDVRALAPMIEAAMRENVRCVLGGEEKIRANEALFGEIRPALRT